MKSSNIKKIIKYVFSSGTSFIVDLSFFTILNYLIQDILFSTIIARIISSLYNYYVNSRFVFKKYNNTSIIKYYVLVIIQMLISACSVSYLSSLISVNDTLIKGVVDIVIFVVNYFIQKEVIFK